MTPQDYPDRALTARLNAQPRSGPSNGTAKLSGNTATLLGGVAVFPKLSPGHGGNGYVLQATITASADDLTPGSEQRVRRRPIPDLAWTGSGDGVNWSDPNNWQGRLRLIPMTTIASTFRLHGAAPTEHEQRCGLTSRASTSEGGGQVERPTRSQVCRHLYKRER